MRALADSHRDPSSAKALSSARHDSAVFGGGVATGSWFVCSIVGDSFTGRPLPTSPHAATDSPLDPSETIILT